MKPECEKCGGNDWRLIESDRSSERGTIMCALCGKTRFEVSTEHLYDTPQYVIRVKL